MSEKNYRARIYERYGQERADASQTPSLARFAARAPYLRKVIREHFPADRRALILDLGCGDGAIVHFAAVAGYGNARGVDVSPAQVSVARQLGLQSVSLGDLLETLRQQESQSIDVMVAFDVIEHFTREELLPFVDEVSRVLKPDGRWILHVPNGQSPFFGAIRFGDLTHELAFTNHSLDQLLLSSGFAEVRCHEDAPIVHGAKSLVRWVLWKMIRAVLRIYVAAETGDPGGRQIFSQNLLAVAYKRKETPHGR